MIAGTRRFWIAAFAVLLVLAIEAIVITSWVSAKVEDAAATALAAEQLSGVEFIEVDGVPRFGTDGLDVVLAGPAADRAAAISAVSARDEIAGVIYRPIDGAAPAEIDDAGDNDEDAVGIEDTKGRPS